MDFFDNMGPQTDQPQDNNNKNDEFPDISNEPVVKNENKESTENNKEDNDFIPIENNLMSNDFNFTEDKKHDDLNAINHEDIETNIVDEEEQKRIEARENEMKERRKKIEEKMSLEIKEKENRREKAVEFMNTFENNRINAINLRKENNKKNEIDYQNTKQLIKEGAKNPWELVTDNISIKESDYKGTKDVTRMRNTILARKNDEANHKINNNDNI